MVNEPKYLLSTLTGYQRLQSCLNSLVPNTTPILLALLLGPSLLPPNHQNLLKRNGKEMEILAAIGVRSSIRQQSEQLSLFSSVDSVDSLKESSILLDRSADDGRHVGSSSAFEPIQIFDISPSKSDGTDSLSLLHSHASLQGSSNTLDDPEHTKVHPVYTCNINDIQQKPDFPDSGTASVSARELPKSEVHSARPSPSATEGALADKNRRAPLDFILGDRASKPTPGQQLSERVCARLIQSEAHESNTSLRSDYRQAFICVSLASKGNPQAFLESSYAVHGIHPDKVWPRILANRKERLGREYYQFFDSNDLPRPDVKWDATVIYDLPSLGAPASAHKPAPETGDGITSSSGPKPSPVHPIQNKEGIA